MHKTRREPRTPSGELVNMNTLAAKLKNCNVFLNSNLTLALYSAIPIEDGYLRSISVEHWVNQETREIEMRKVFSRKILFFIGLMLFFAVDKSNYI